MKNGNYILVIAPDWYKGKRYRNKYCYEHHLVWEKNTGNPVCDGYVIHHKDKNKYNNDFNNLELLKVKEHTKLHKGMIKKRVAIIKCPSCGKIFERDARILPFRTLVFCSRRCIGIYGYGSKKGGLENKIKESKKENIIKIIKK